MPPRRRYRVWRSGLVAVAVVALLGAAPGLGPGVGRAQALVPPSGQASSTAQSYRVNPQAGSLSLGIGFGISLSQFQNRVAIAEARGIDLGIIGQLLAAPSCSGGAPTLPAKQQPQPVHVEARDGDHDVQQRGQDAGVFDKLAHATDQPLADSVVTTAATIVPDVLSLGPARSESISRFLADGTREALATSDVGAISFGPSALPLAQLDGLHWEVRYDTGPRPAKVQKVTIGSASIAGIPIPTSDPVATIQMVNQAVKTLGFELQAPRSYEGSGYLFVDPLKIGVIPNDTRDHLIGGLLQSAQPVRQAVVDALLKVSCQFGIGLTVADVVVGSMSGAGAFEIEVGGVHATSGIISAFEFPAPPAPPVLPAVSGGSFSSPAPVAAPAAQPSAAPAVNPVVGSVAASPLPRPVGRVVRGGGTRGGRLALIGGVGLAVLAAVAEADRRKMRRAQRAMAVEA